MSDKQISNAIEGALRSNQIDVETTAGIVTLTGTVDHLIAKERAAAIARTFNGVRGVVNALTLQTAPITDDTLRKNVELALLYDAATDSYRIKTAARDGVVTLSGIVQSHLEKQLAVRVAKGIKGVREVKEDLVVSLNGNRSDAEIALEVKRVLAIDAWLELNFITTEVKDGVVTLTGEVGGASQHVRASQLAWTAGVRSVNAEGLRVVPGARRLGQRKETFRIKSEVQLKQAVKDTLARDPRVAAFNVGVDVLGSVVTLTGVVDNLKAKRAAEQAARNTVGVWRAVSLIKVRPVAPLADHKTAQAVKSAFLRDPIVDEYQIDARAKRGVVTLTGTVDSYYERAQAEDLAARANGVIEVRNGLTVTYPALHQPTDPETPNLNDPPYYSLWTYYTTDAEVQANIEDAWFWDSFVNSDQLAVKVENGVATLTGVANSWLEFHLVTKGAYQGGARQVFNNIRVK